MNAEIRRARPLTKVLPKVLSTGRFPPSLRKSQFEFPTLAHAELPPDCEGLGSALTEHSCFHSTLGPFEFRKATPGNVATEDTLNVNPVHTEYRVLLSLGQSSLTYRPERTGSFAAFTGRDVPLTIHREGEGASPVLYQTAETGCEALPLARVYDLDGDLTYTFTFESEAASDVALVIEFVDDFSIQNGIDRDGDGYGDPSEAVKSVCVPPAGHVQNTSDCDDTNPAIHPGATELCGDAIDQNCNGLPDDTALGCRTGVGVCATQGVSACGDDGRVMCIAQEASPSDELCNGKDDDCDGLIDEESALCPGEDRPHCVRFGFAASCGCQFDSDCAENDSSLHTCDVTLGTCVEGEPAGAGGAPGTGGEGGEASGGDASGGGASGGEPGSGGEDASGGAAGENTASGGRGEEKAPPGPGCSCNTGASQPMAPDLSSLLIVSLLFWQTRRKRAPRATCAS